MPRKIRPSRPVAAPPVVIRPIIPLAAASSSARDRAPPAHSSMVSSARATDAYRPGTASPAFSSASPTGQTWLDTAQINDERCSRAFLLAPGLLVMFASRAPGPHCLRAAAAGPTFRQETKDAQVQVGDVGLDPSGS